MADLIIIPTYNERENLPPLLEKIFDVVPAIEILIIDDNSPDKTGELVEHLQQSTYPKNLHLIKRSGKLGLGTAYITGFKWALERDYHHVFEMDADFSHNPRYLPDFLARAKSGADLVLGSRYVAGGGVKNWGLLRRIISRGGSLYAKVILGIPLNDLTGGFKCFKRRVLENLDLDNVQCAGYAFQIELTYRAWLQGFNIQETPIIFADRTVGQSKMSKKIFLEAVWMVLWMRFHKKQLQGIA